MDKILSIAQIIGPILAAVVLGMIARRKQIMTTQKDYTIASGICSLLTIPAPLVFCIIAAFVS